MGVERLALLREIESIVGEGNVLADPDELLAYECDGLTFHRCPPDFVAFPTSTEQIVALVKLSRRHSLPFVARGAGTGLSGGALASQGGIVIETSRMKQIGNVDEFNRCVEAQPGIINVDVTRSVTANGFFFAPDPSSQTACTLGGNVAENSGGPHCLKHGTTVNHVLEITAVLPDGELVQLGGPAADTPGYDVCGVFVGSEGTFGIAAQIRIRLLRAPQAVVTLLAAYGDAEDATRSVSDVVAAGIVPVALEMMDSTIIRAVEDSNFRAGYPRDAAAVLLIELDGLESAITASERRIREICARNRSTEIRVARDPAERAALWAGRKKAFGACGRLSPNMYLSDTVVPRNRLPEILAKVYEITRRHRIPVANVFHAGDGNLHPILLYDAKDKDETQRMLAACAEIIEACVAVGGCLSGEHGIGMEKREFMARQFSEADLEAMLRVKHAFDPDGVCNPDKILPQRIACREVRGVRAAAGMWV